MKAIYFKEHGGPEVLEYGELPSPTPSQGEARIKVRAVALNHLDIWVRRGWPGLNLTMPHIGGSDIAGEIIELEDSTSSFVVGDRVIANPGISTSTDRWTEEGEESLSPGYKIIGEHIPGAMAEEICIPISNLKKIPDEVSFEDAAAPVLTSLTCWRMLFTRGALKAGETVLVVGSGGGVNSLSIILAKSHGAKVIALAGGEEKTALAKKLGASEVIDYKANPEWHKDVLKLTSGLGVDLVVDNVGKATYGKSIKSAARGGRILTVGNTSGYDVTIDNRMIFAKQISIIGSTMGSNKDFETATEYLWDNKIKPVIDIVAPLSDGIEQLRRLEAGEQFGKIVLVP